MICIRFLYLQILTRVLRWFPRQVWKIRGVNTPVRLAVDYHIAHFIIQADHFFLYLVKREGTAGFDGSYSKNPAGVRSVLTRLLLLLFDAFKQF